MAQVLNAKIEPLVSYWNEEIKLHPNVNLRLKTEVTTADIKALNPDEVVVAPGGGVIQIDVPGIDGKNVVKSEDIKAMVGGHVPEGKGLIWKAAVAAIKSQGGTVGFMRFGLNMSTGPTAIVGKRVVIVGGGFAGLGAPRRCAKAVRSPSSRKPRSSATASASSTRTPPSTW